MSPDTLPRVEIIAHRGLPRLFPENSLPGFERAIAVGADAIELDVHLTADQALAVHHDPVIAPAEARRDRPGVSSGKLRIRDLTAGELREHYLAPGVPVPLLPEVLSLVGGRATVYVEVKAAEALDTTLACIESSAARCAVHAFDHRVARRTHERQPRGAPIPTGILLSSYLVDPVSALGAARARDYWQQWDQIDSALVERIHAAHGRVIAWTVNDPTEAGRLAGLGVDGICTDVCDVIKPAVDV